MIKSKKRTEIRLKLQIRFKVGVRALIELPLLYLRTARALITLFEMTALALPYNYNEYENRRVRFLIVAYVRNIVFLDA